MLKNDKKTLALYNLKSSKTMWIITLLLIFTSTIMIFGFSYLEALNKFWTDWTNKSYDFRLFLVSYENEKKADVYNALKNNDHIQDIFTYSEFMTGATLNDFKSNNVDGQIRIFGTTPGTKKIAYGNDLSSNENEIICALNFLPKSMIQNSEYDSSLVTNLKSYVNSTIDVTFFKNTKNEFSKKMTLVGAYDDAYDFSDTNICYVNHSLLKQINDKYQPDLAGNDGYFYILLDNINNADAINGIGGINSLKKIKNIKIDLAYKIITITMLVMIISYFIIIIITNFFLSKEFKDNYRKYGLFLSIGYTSIDILNIEREKNFIIIYIVSFTSLIFALLLCKYYPILFLKNEMQLSKINIHLSFVAIIINFIIVSLLLLLTYKRYINNLNKINPVNCIKEKY